MRIIFIDDINRMERFINNKIALYVIIEKTNDDYR